MPRWAVTSACAALRCAGAAQPDAVAHRHHQQRRFGLAFGLVSPALAFPSCREAARAIMSLALDRLWQAPRQKGVWASVSPFVEVLATHHSLLFAFFSLDLFQTPFPRRSKWQLPTALFRNAFACADAPTWTPNLPLRAPAVSPTQEPETRDCRSNLVPAEK